MTTESESSAPADTTDRAAVAGGGGGGEVPRATARQQQKATVISLVAWALDLFDLFIILFVAATIGPLLFPTSNPIFALAAVYASFAVTLVMRPVGSAVFGPMADRTGRRRAMGIAIVGVGLSTGLMGAVPTYETAGVLAPIAFLLLRLVQGVFVGGVVASTHTLGTETANPRHRGLLSGLIGGGGAGLGAMFAAITYLIVSTIFPGEAFSVWGWRVMFFTGLLGAAVSWLLFRNVEESPIWKARAAAQQPKESTLRVLWSRAHRRTFFLSLTLTMSAGTIYYLTLGYLPTILGKTVIGLPGQESAIILIIASAAAVASSIGFGALSERIGRRRAFMISGVLAVPLLPLVTILLAATPAASFAAIVGFGIVLGVVGNATYAPMMVFLNECFPTELRATGTGLVWNLGFAIGGMMPTFATLASPTPADLPVSVAVFCGVAALALIAAAAANPETRGRFT